MIDTGGAVRPRILKRRKHDPRPKTSSTALERYKKQEESIRENQEVGSDIVRWVEANRIIDNEPWSFDSTGPRIQWGRHDIKHDKLARPYLYEILRSTSQMISIIKMRQSELTENHINKALYYSVVKGCKIHHMFPTDGDAQAISNEKIQPAIDDSPKILQFRKHVGAVHRQMFFGGGIYTNGGALKRGEGRGQSRDILIYDEWDLIPVGIRGPYQKSLSHSKYQYEWFISTPTTMGVGIDAMFSDGSQNNWTFVCEHCKKEQQWSWPDNLIGCPDKYYEPSFVDKESKAYQKAIDGVYWGCSKCHKYIDRNGEHYIKTSRWIAERPGLADIHASYKILAAMIAWKTAKEILGEFHDYQKYIWQFYNEVWGTSYQRTGSRLERSDMENEYVQRLWKQPTNHTATMRDVSIGVDWGDRESWVVVRANGFDERDKNMSCVIYTECISRETLRQRGLTGDDKKADIEHVQRVIHLANVFQAQVIVNDANGLGTDRHKQLRRAFPDRVWGAFWDTQETSAQLSGRKPYQPKKLEASFNSSDRKVTISQINLLREIQRKYRSGEIGIPAIVGDAAPILEKFVLHHTGLGIQQQWSKEYEKEYDVVRQYGEHHLLDADIYAEIGQHHLTSYQSSALGFA